MAVEILKLVRDAFKAIGILALAAILIGIVCLVDWDFAF